jgi:hypothetical protein
MLAFLDRTEDQTKASGNFKLIFLSTQSTHLGNMLLPIGHACLRTYAPLGDLGGKNSSAT